MKDLQKIRINARPPVIIAVNGENESINVIIEYFNKCDYQYLMEYCGGDIKNIIKNLPSPIITDSSIFSLYYGAKAYKKSGEALKQKACLKILYSLQNCENLLNDRAIELLNRGINEYIQIAEDEGANELNSIDINEIKFKSSGCFIATAVYGSEYTPEVTILRGYRDNVLLLNNFGRLFVKLYYSISPPIAKQIEKSTWLKNIVNILIVKPMLLIAKRAVH